MHHGSCDPGGGHHHSGDCSPHQPSPDAAGESPEILEPSELPYRYQLYGWSSVALFLLAMGVGTGHILHWHYQVLWTVGLVVACIIYVAFGKRLLRGADSALGAALALGAPVWQALNGVSCIMLYHQPGWVAALSAVPFFCGWTVTPALTVGVVRRIEFEAKLTQAETSNKPTE